MTQPSLGRGLSALIPKRGAPPTTAQNTSRPATPTDGEAVLNLPVALIDANPQQPRHSFDYHALEDLIASIKVHGILQPLIVTTGGNGRYELIAGERRLRAAKTLNLKTVPAIVRTATTQAKLELALIENIQRKDLNPMEESDAYQALIDEFGLTQEEVAKRVGKNRATIANTLRLLNLAPEIQKSLRDGQLSMGHAKVILSVTDAAEQRKLWHSILKNDLTVRGGEALNRSLRPKQHRRQADPKTHAFEDELRSALNTRVSISRRGDRGTISIEYYSDEELENIVRKITE